MGSFSQTPSAAGYADYKYGTSSSSTSPPLQLTRFLSEAPAEAAAKRELHARVLRPVLDLLLLAAMILPWRMWWSLKEEQCWNPSYDKAAEPTLLRITRGIWIAWLTHAAGLLDEALRVFLGVRLTMGLGSPTSVDKTYTKMSRRAEIVAEVCTRWMVAIRSAVCYPWFGSRYTRGVSACLLFCPALSLSSPSFMYLFRISRRIVLSPTLLDGNNVCGA